MASILPGFEYDIFISYRHKDNKYDGWVTEFVTNLQREIGATFKEDISIYFDSNPYDGLLETHSVGKSLEAKLKSVVFIPVISQTYCDTKSFAWQHEFCVFNKQSKDDSFGRDIKLSNGNVASRILPVRIHDLDQEDTVTFENETGGPMRAVEFIYKSAGVNRPLRADDKREDNLSRLFYRDQINKVANAVKQITNGIRFPGRVERAEEKKFTPTEIVEKNPSDQTNNSIAVLPFVNLSQDASQEYFVDGITENIIIQLASLRQLRVISRTSMMRYKKTMKSAPEIATELNVKNILEGSAQMHVNKVRIQVQLIDALKEEHLWSKVFIESMDDIFTIQNTVSEVVANELHAKLGVSEIEKIKEVPTRNPEAYDLLLKGRHAFNQWGVMGYRTATDYFKQAIGKDPELKEAYSYLASSYSARMSWNGDLSPEEAKVNIDQYLAEAWKRGPSDNDYLTKAFVEFFVHKNFEEAEKLLLQSIDLNANNASALYAYSYLLTMMGRVEEADQWVSKAKIIDPLTVAYFNYRILCQYFLKEDKEALLTLGEALQLYPGVLRFYDFQARIFLTIGKYEETVSTILKGLSTSDLRPPSLIAYLGCAYFGLNEKKKCNELLNELIARSQANEKGVNIYVVHLFNGMGDYASALQWLEKAKESNDVDLIWWQVDPLLKDLREKADQVPGISDVDYVAAEQEIIALLEEKMPKLPYHNIDHIFDVLKAAMIIAETSHLHPDEIKLLRLAALYHDAGFIQSAIDHEAHGAQMAREILSARGLNAAQIEIICKMILSTRLPQSPTTELERILCDADLDYLGRDDFYEIGNRLWQELKTNGVVETEREWNVMQKTFLDAHRFHTIFSKANREVSKRARVQEITDRLRSRT